MMTGVRNNPTIQNEIAEAKPIHYGIFFYPAFDPFLFMSFPVIFFANINSLILGINIFVNIQLTTPNTVTITIERGFSCVRIPPIDKIETKNRYLN